MPTLPVDAIGFGAAVLTTLCWAPQVIHILKTRDTRAISLATQSALAAGIVLWLVYGLLIGSFPIIAANAVTFLLVAAVLAMKLRYG